VTPQFGASLADNSRVVGYDRNMFIVQATVYNLSSGNTNSVEGLVVSTVDLLIKIGCFIAKVNYISKIKRAGLI
jgi:hypothetical protein